MVLVRGFHSQNAQTRQQVEGRERERERERHNHDYLIVYTPSGYKCRKLPTLSILLPLPLCTTAIIPGEQVLNVHHRRCIFQKSSQRRTVSQRFISTILRGSDRVMHLSEPHRALGIPTAITVYHYIYIL